MTTTVEKFFVRGFIKFLNQQILDKPSSENSEAIEVAVQCLESCFDIPQNPTPEEKSNPLNNVDLYDLFVNTYVTVNPERKAEAELMKNEGNRLMKEEKYQEALNMYGK